MQHAPISRARYMQENRKMRFLDVYDGWNEGRLTQAETALLLGQCERSFSPHIECFKGDGLAGLLDKRLSQIPNDVTVGPRSITLCSCTKAALRAGT